LTPPTSTQLPPGQDQPVFNHELFTAILCRLKLEILLKEKKAAPLPPSLPPQVVPPLETTSRVTFMSTR
jgi:hypothetical protein